MRLRRTAAATAILVTSLLAGHVALAAQPAEPDQVQVDALRCWRNVGGDAVRVGEPFTMTVTCAVIETPAAFPTRWSSPLKRLMCHRSR